MFDKKCRKIENSPNVQFDIKIKKRIITRYCFGSTKTFQCVIILTLFKQKKMQKTIDQAWRWGVRMISLTCAHHPAAPDDATEILSSGAALDDATVF